MRFNFKLWDWDRVGALLVVLVLVLVLVFELIAFNLFESEFELNGADCTLPLNGGRELLLEREWFVVDRVARIKIVHKKIEINEICLNTTNKKYFL